MPAPHHSVFYRPDALPAAQPTASKHWRQTASILYYRNVLNNSAFVKLQSKHICKVRGIPNSSLLISMPFFELISRRSMNYEKTYPQNYTIVSMTRQVLPKSNTVNHAEIKHIYKQWQANSSTKQLNYNNLVCKFCQIKNFFVHTAHILHDILLLIIEVN